MDFLDFIKLRSETISSIRARIDSDVNAGLEPTSPDWIDTTEGGFFFDMTQPVVLELQRLWDLASSETPAAAFPAFAWGDYLDEHGETIGLARKAAVAATGTIHFTGTTGAIVAVGTEVATSPTGPNDDAIVFQTTASGTFPAGGVLDLPIVATLVGSQGNVLANTITVLASPNTGIASVTNQAALSGGSDVETDQGYRARILNELSAAQGAGTIADYQRWALAYPGIGGATVTAHWNGPGTVRVVVVDAFNKPVSFATQNGLQDQLDPPTFLTTTTAGPFTPPGTLTVATTTGSTATGTLIASSSTTNSATLTYTGKTATTFTGVTGSGTFPVGSRIAQGFANGTGLAPIGALVTVQTPVAINVTVSGTVTPASGYSLNGTGGTIALSADLTREITAYLTGLGPGDDVVLNAVESRFFRVRGVYDVSGVQIGLFGGASAAANYVIAAQEVATPSTITLT